MKYIRQFVQETITASTPEEFDILMNAVYSKASEAGKEPDIHFFDRDDFCASVRYFVSKTVPENIKDERELAGDYRYCAECPLFELPSDKRIKYVKCPKHNSLVNGGSRACNEFYEEEYGKN